MGEVGGDGCVGAGVVTTDSILFILFPLVGWSDHHHYASDKSIKLFVEARVQAKGGQGSPKRGFHHQRMIKPSKNKRKSVVNSVYHTFGHSHTAPRFMK